MSTDEQSHNNDQEDLLLLPPLQEEEEESTELLDEVATKVNKSHQHPEDDGQKMKPLKKGDEPKLLVDDKTGHRDIKAFVNSYLPADCHEDDTPWIWVQREITPPQIPSNTAKTIKQEWESICQDGQANSDALHALALKHCVLSGKWMIFCSPRPVNPLWRHVAYKVLHGSLSSAKVSPISSRGAKNQHVICVYVANYLNEQDVWRVRNVLSHTLDTVGYHQKLGFKLDIVGLCGISSGDPYGIPMAAFTK